MQVSKISVSKITDQYLAYVLMMHELNFDFASEFLVMAATLIHWKSKSLLPEEQKAEQAAVGEEFMTEEELIRQLLEHQRFLAAGQSLAQLPRLGEDVFTRNNPKPPIERVWREMNITDLALGYQDMLVKARKRTQILKKETVSLADKIVDFADRLEVGKMVGMRKLLSAVPTDAEVVVTFLASLELARLKRLRLFQEKTYEEILIELIASLKNFDMSMASGFDAETPPADSVNPAPHKVDDKVTDDLAGIAGAFEAQFLNSGQGLPPAAAES